MSTKKIHLDLNLDETNLILEALGQQPFARVYALIGRIQEQAREQLNTEAPAAADGKASEPGA